MGDAEVQRIVRLTLAGNSVRLVGGPWSGRSSTLEGVRRCYQQSGISYLLLRGIGDSLPLDALRLALSDTVHSPTEMLAPAAILLNRLVTLNPSLILVDDGDDLDKQSWTVVEAIHKTMRTPLVLSLRRRCGSGTDDGEPASIRRLWRSAAQLELRNLDGVGTRALIEERLGGAASASLVGRIYTKSAGIPGFVRAFVDAALEAGTIRHDGELYVDQPQIWSPQLDAICESYLASQPAELFDSLEMLSLLGTVRLNVARSRLGQSTIERLERAGLAALYISDRKAWISVCPPGIAEYYRRRPPSARTIRLREVANFRGTGADQAGPRHREPSETVAQRARELPFLSRRFAESFERAAVAEVPRARALTARELRLQLTSLPRLGVRVRDRTAEEVARGRPEEELHYRYLQSRRELASGSSVETCRHVLTQGLAAGFEYRDAVETLSYAIGMERDRIPVDYANYLTPRAARGGLNGEVARLVLCYGHLLTDRPRDALEMTRGDLAEGGTFAHEYRAAHGLALYATGRIRDAAAWAAREVERSIEELDRAALVRHSFVLVSALTLLGRHTEAAEAGQLTLTANLTAVPALFAPDRGAMLALAAAAVRAERGSEADVLLSRARQFSGLSEGLPFAQIDVVTAARLVTNGRRCEARDQYISAAASLAARGFGLAADTATLLALAAQFDRERALEFRDRAALVSSDLFQCYLDAWDAGSRRDADALAAAAYRMRAESAHEESIRLMLQAVAVHRSRGAAEKAKVLREELGRWRKLRTGDGEPTQSIFPPEQDLTAREQEVSQFVADGMTNVQIGDRMGISVRTVETHIRNVKRKIGVTLREDIASFGPGDSGAEGASAT